MAVEARAWITGEYPNQKINFELPSGPKGDPGGWVATTINSGGDLNTYRTAGTYQVPSATGVLNLPGLEAGTLQINTRITGGNYESCDQIFTPYSGVISARAVYRRAYVSQAWTPWWMYTSTRVDNTVGKAIYQWDPTAGKELLIYGDTGVRKIELINGWTNGLVGPFLQRKGDTVYFGAYNVSPANRTDPTAYILPTGFRPHRGTLSFNEVLGGAANVQTTGNLLPNASNNSFGGGLTFISWVTQDNWPTTLPGVSG